MGFPDLKLICCDRVGRAEPIRLALHISDIPFEDERLSDQEWESFRRKTPFGTCPIMTVNGTLYSQTAALLRYAGYIGGLEPSNPILRLAVDQILGGVDDVVNALVPSIHETDAAKKMQLRTEALETQLPPYLQGLDSLAGQTSEGFSVGNQLTIADLSIYSLLNWFKSGEIEGCPPEAIDIYANLTAVHKMVSKHGKVADWIAAHRP